MNDKIKKHFPRFLYIFFFLSPILAIKLFIILFLTLNKPKYEWYAYKHKVILTYLKKKLKKTINLYKNKKNEVIPFTEKYPIWVFWWQGEDTMPAICKTCYENIKYYSNGHPVYLLTKDNFKEFINIPDYIIKKVNKKKYSLAFFSDILRMCLLYEHGGLWLDLTVLLTKPIQPFPEICNHLGFWVPKDNGEIIASCFGAKNWIVRENRWVSFCIFSTKNNILPEYVRALFFAWVKKYNILIDYFTVDYMTSIAYDTNSDVRVMIDSVPKNNEKLHDILHRLNLDYEYNETLFNEICEVNDFHKLNWKDEIPEYTKDNKLTNYGYILNNFPPRQ